MSTRGVQGFHIHGQDKLQYNHFDSYPEGLGEDIVAILRRYTPDDLPEIIDNIEHLVLSNDAQDECPLSYYLDGTVEEMPNSGNDFINDSLFCEWGYIINLDTRMFEVWVGFQTSPTEGNRFGTKKVRDYYPCALLKEYPLFDIPENWVEEVNKLEEDED